MTKTCWKAHDAERLLGVDAGPPDDVSDAAFLATHVPWRGRRLHGALTDLEEARRSTDVVDLQGVAEELFDEWGRDEPVVWVHGSPGTGKSHLVRHMYLRAEQWVEEHGGALTEELVFVPKSAATSLKSVLELILKDRTGKGIERLRDNIRNAAEGMTEEHAAKELLSSLAFLIDVDVTSKDMPQRFEARNWRTGERDVAELLRDFLVDRPVWSQATDPDCFASRIAAVRLGKVRAADRGDDDLEVTPALLPLEAKPADLGAGARHLHDKLMASAEVQASACKVLNYHLDRAVQKVFGIDSGLVTDAALELRRLLKQEGKRLWLFFEDFAVLQGIQGELLDVFTSFDADLCDLRVAGAITPGPFQQLPQMIFGRTRETIDLDVPMTEAEGLRDELIVRYLNATRVGDERLAAASPTVPNQCTHCPFGEAHRERCFDAFGTMEVDEVGEVSLFPFNRLTLERGVSKVNPGDGGQVFNPRFLLTRVLRPVLRGQHHAIEKGRFPSEGVVNELTRPADRLEGYIREEIEEEWTRSGVAKADAERGVFATLLYGPYDDALAEVFGLPAHEGSDSPPPPTPQGANRRGPTPPPRPVADPENVAELKRWSQHRGEESAAASLASATLRATRRALRLRILDGLAATGEGPDTASFDEHFKDAFRDIDVVIDGNAAKASKVTKFEVSPSDDGALVALMWDASGETPTEDLSRLRRQLDRLVARGQQHVREAVLAPITDPDAIRWVVSHWVVAHAALGGRVPSSVEQLLESPVPSAGQTGPWAQAQEHAANLLEAARGAFLAIHGFGIGEIGALDAVILAEAFRNTDLDLAPAPSTNEEAFPVVGETANRFAARLQGDDIERYVAGVAKFHDLVDAHLEGAVEEVTQDLLDLIDAMFVAANSGDWQLDHYHQDDLRKAERILKEEGLDGHLEQWRTTEVRDLVPGSARWVAAMARHELQQPTRGPIRATINHGIRFVEQVEVEPVDAHESLDVESQLVELIDRLNKTLGAFHGG